jgi:hypothetical protein
MFVSELVRELQLHAVQPVMLRAVQDVTAHVPELPAVVLVPIVAALVLVLVWEVVAVATVQEHAFLQAPPVPMAHVQFLAVPVVLPAVRVVQVAVQDVAVVVTGDVPLLVGVN